MSFRPDRFFEGFSSYLRDQRAGTLAFLAATASFEHWLQFEAGGWLHEHREEVGLGSEHWSIALELRKGDAWLVNGHDSPHVGIEFKLIP